MRSLVDAVPLPRALAEAVVIATLFLAAVVASRLAGLLAASLVDRDARRVEAADSGLSLARLQRRETAASLTRTTVRYVSFGVALLLSVLTLSGARGVETLAGGAFLAIVVGFAIQRVLMDIVAGLLIFFENWFEVGDTVAIEPNGLQGVVEEVSLRSVRLRGLNGEVIHVQNSQVQAARIIPRGVRELEIELFVNDLEGGERLVERLRRLVPVGLTQFVRPPEVVESEPLDEDLYRITATAAVAPAGSGSRTTCSSSSRRNGTTASSSTARS